MTSGSHNSNEAGESRAAGEDRVEAVLVDVFGEPEADWEAALARACQDHPELAADLQRRFASVRQAGLEVGQASREFPSRLGPFELVEQIGEGGMGVVYRAKQDGLERPVALKLVRPEMLYFPGSKERLKREVEIVSRFEHPGIVPIYAVGEENGIPFYAMELVRGLSLDEVVLAFRGRQPAQLGSADLWALFRERLGAGTELPGETEVERRFGRGWVEICFGLVRQAAEALHHAHRQGVLHRDVKPSNMIVTPDGRLRLLDFGLSLTQHATRVTRTGTTVGSLPYMAPEQITGKWLDPRTDVYALGVSLYELLTLRCPFLAPSQEETRRRVLGVRALPPRELHHGLPWDAETVCLVAMDVDPGRRYGSAEALAHDASNVLAHRPIAARRPGVLLRARRWSQRHPTLTVAALSALLIVLLGPVAMWLQARAHGRQLQGTLTELSRLSDEVVLEELRQGRDVLWPAVPRHAAAIGGGVARARNLLGRGETHARDLARLRQRALPLSAQEIEQDRGQRQRAVDHLAEVERVHAATARYVAAGTIEARQLALVESELVAARQALQERYTWRFASDTETWQHRSLQRILDGLRALPREIEVMEARWRFAREVDERSLVKPARQWESTIAAIADVRTNPTYGGLALRPQLGLVPLGQDPESRLFEFAHLLTGEPPERDPGTGKLRLLAASGLVLVLLPGGEFVIGARRAPPDALSDDPRADPNAKTDETPPEQPIRLGPFFVSKFEMTQGQWLRLTGDNPSIYQPSESAATSLHPVGNLSWNACDVWLRRAQLALPTEAQWEYAARAGVDAPWYSGHDVRRLRKAANLLDRRGKTIDMATVGDFIVEPWDDGYATTAPVGSFLANRFGLHDVLGNLREWCRDHYFDYTAVTWQPGDGYTGQVIDDVAVCRGGSFLTLSGEARVSARAPQLRSNSGSEVGVRPVRAIEVP